MADLISPGNGSFTSDKIANTLKEKLSDFSKSKADCLKNRMMQNINGELIFNEDLIYEYLKKDAGEISQEEAEVLVETISYIQNAKVYYETLAEYGTDEFGATIARQVAWMADDKKYKSFTAVSKHYNDLYINVLNAMEENTKDQKSIAYSLVKMINGDTSIELFGTEAQQDLKKYLEMFHLLNM